MNCGVLEVNLFFLLQGFFTYLYGMSILFFLYVFGYLLRSKRRKELKRRQRKISRWRTLPPSKNEDGLSSSPSGSISVRMDGDGDPPTAPATPAPLNRILNSSIHGQRRRSIATSASLNDLSNYAPLPPSPLVTGGSQSSNGHRGLQWTPSALSLNLVEETSSDAVSYAMNSANVVVSSGSGKVKKMKVSDNEHSHGSFFLRAGAVGNDAIRQFNSLLLFNEIPVFLLKLFSVCIFSFRIGDNGLRRP